MTLSVLDIDRCFQRVLPGVIATSDKAGIPNINYVTQIQVVDERHIALSYQFPTKTRVNLEQNPRASLEVYDPLTLDAYRLDLRLDHIETSGPLFDRLALRIEAIASHTGLAQIFRLRAAYVCEVLAIEKRDGFLDAPMRPSFVSFGNEPLTEMRGLRLVSERISRAQTLDELLTGALAALAEVFGFAHSTILVPGDDPTKLVTIASHGYDGATVGAEVTIGEGLIGLVAKSRQLLRILGLDANLRHGRHIRAEVARRPQASQLVAEVPLPGLPDARSQLAIPLVVEDRLLGVLALEARDTATFSQWHESFLQVLANQIASAMESMSDDVEDSPAETRHALVYFRNDDCIFIDDEYLIRNVPAKILWKLLHAYSNEGRTEFSNRELRLDPKLGLPAVKDNLESRLILLRKRLAEKCPAIRLVPTTRGHFSLEVDCKLDLSERETG